MRGRCSSRHPSSLRPPAARPRSMFPDSRCPLGLRRPAGGSLHHRYLNGQERLHGPRSRAGRKGGRIERRGVHPGRWPRSRWVTRPPHRRRRHPSRRRSGRYALHCTRLRGRHRKWIPRPTSGGLPRPADGRLRSGPPPHIHRRRQSRCRRRPRRNRHRSRAMHAQPARSRRLARRPPPVHLYRPDLRPDRGGATRVRCIQRPTAAAPTPPPECMRDSRSTSLWCTYPLNQRMSRLQEPWETFRMDQLEIVEGNDRIRGHCAHSNCSHLRSVEPAISLRPRCPALVQPWLRKRLE